MLTSTPVVFSLVAIALSELYVIVWFMIFFMVFYIGGWAVLQVIKPIWKIISYGD